MDKIYLSRLAKGIIKSIRKFNLNLKNRILLTEAATGNYVVTPIIAALSGAKKVYAFTKDSEYGSIDDVKLQTYSLAKLLNVENRIIIITSLDSTDIEWESIDILTNTGFLRPISRKLVGKLSNKCVIPLMYEPWEFREGEIDLEACYKKGIKVYGTNENDPRLRTIDYIGFIVLYFLLKHKYSPFSCPNILMIGSRRFVEPSYYILSNNGYEVDKITNYSKPIDYVDKYDIIIVMEYNRKAKIIGERGKSLIAKESIRDSTLVIHICGDVDFSNVKFKYEPKKVKPLGRMSLTTDFIDPQAVIDLHAAGLKVAEGMLEANKLGLKGLEYKLFMEENYPALAFQDPKFW